MRQVYIGIFAHPDDESFGPSGSLMQYIAAGADVHLLCATTGQSGEDAVGAHDLGAVRLQEWQAAGKKLGAKSMHQLGFRDGELSNNQFHAIAEACEHIITEILKTYPHDTDFTLLTMDENGLSGHIDHMVMSAVTSYIFVRLQDSEPRIKNVHYYCLSESQADCANCDYVYMPKGRPVTEIDITNDITDVFEAKKELMRLHASQAADAAQTIAKFEEHTQKLEHFYTFKP